MNGEKYLSGELDLYCFRTQIANFYDLSRPAVVKFEWAEPGGLSSTIEISEDENFSDVFMKAVCCNRFYCYNLECGKKYYWRVTNPKEQSQVFSFTTQDLTPRFLYFDGTTNVRDIGGYVTRDERRVKQGLLIRGAELDMHAVLSECGKKTMRGDFGIKTDIDLRGEAIGFSKESPLGKDVKFVQVPMRAYEEYVKEENFENIVKVFEVLSDENNYPVYFHCWGGADRTGCLAFTIEAILGLDEEKMMQDFEITCLSGMGNVKNRNDEDFSSMIKTLMTYGDGWEERMTNFVLKCGVPMENVEKMKNIMLEEK